MPKSSPGSPRQTRRRRRLRRPLPASDARAATWPQAETPWSDSSTTPRVDVCRGRGDQRRCADRGQRLDPGIQTPPDRSAADRPRPVHQPRRPLATAGRPGHRPTRRHGNHQIPHPDPSRHAVKARDLTCRFPRLPRPRRILRLRPHHRPPHRRHLPGQPRRTVPTQPRTKTFTAWKNPTRTDLLDPALGRTRPTRPPDTPGTHDLGIWTSCWTDWVAPCEDSSRVEGRRCNRYRTRCEQLLIDSVGIEDPERGRVTSLCGGLSGPCRRLEH